MTLMQFVHKHLHEKNVAIRAMFIQMYVHNGLSDWDNDYGGTVPQMVLCTYEIPLNANFQEYCNAGVKAPDVWKAEEVEAPETERVIPMNKDTYFHKGIIWFQDGSWSEIDTEGEYMAYVWVHHNNAPTMPNHW